MRPLSKNVREQIVDKFVEEASIENGEWPLQSFSILDSNHGYTKSDAKRDFGEMFERMQLPDEVADFFESDEGYKLIEPAVKYNFPNCIVVKFLRSGIDFSGLGEMLYDCLDISVNRLVLGYRFYERPRTKYVPAVHGLFLGDDVQIDFEKHLTSLYIKCQVVEASRVIRMRNPEGIDDDEGYEVKSTSPEEEKNDAKVKIESFAVALQNSPEESELFASLGYHRNALFRWFGFGKTASTLEEVREFVEDHQGRCSNSYS
ncbi:MAG: hypothetical protein ACE365_05245 [Gammaproteobacteria bacterium]